MRTTVTLEPDVAAKLREMSTERRISFKAAINATLRAGLAAKAGRGSPYRERATDLGIRPGVDLTKALQLAATLEDDEAIHELALRK